MGTTRYKLIGGPRKQHAKPKDGEPRISKFYVQRYRLLDETKVRSVSLCTTDMSVARRIAVEMVERKIHNLEHPHDNKSLTQHLNDFEQHQRADNWCEKHIRQNKSKITLLLTGLTRIEQITEDVIKLKILHLQDEKKIGPQTAIHYRAAIKQFTRWLYRQKRLPADPLMNLMRGTHRDVKQEKPRRAFTRPELARLIKNARRGKPYRGLSGQQRAVLYEVASQTGFRAQELASITPAAIMWDEPSITIDCTISKRRKRDRQEIKPATAKALRRLSRGLRSDQKIWPGRWWEKAAEMLRWDMEGIQESTPEGWLTFHSLRHTMITRVVESGAPPNLVMEICRLSDPSLLERYYHSNADQRRGIIDSL